MVRQKFSFLCLLYFSGLVSVHHGHLTPPDGPDRRTRSFATPRAAAASIAAAAAADGAGAGGGTGSAPGRPRAREATGCG